MAGVAQSSSSAALVGAYAFIGLILGGLATLITFIGGWIYAVSEYGFLLGGALGWIPATILSLILGALIRFLWPVILLGGVALALKTNPQSSPTVTSTQPATAEAAGPVDPSPTAPTFAASPPVQSEPPPPRKEVAAKAVRDLRSVYVAQGISGAIGSVMLCYGKLAESSAWSEWDYCAALDKTGNNINDSVQKQLGSSPYFDLEAVKRRQFEAAQKLKFDSEGNGDRVSAINSMSDQSLLEIAQAYQSSINTPAPAENSLLTSEVTATPSFDCSKARSDNLRLICSTPSLAQADQGLASAYRAALAASPIPEVIKSGEQDWIRERNNAPSDVAGLQALYSKRISELNAATAQATAARAQ